METLEHVLEQLDGAIAWAKREPTRIGFFAAIYKRVTLEVDRMLKANEFSEPEALVRLDVDFARRYLAALHAYRTGARPTRAWRLAFAASANERLLIVQQLLLGINAHINLDLGISCARAAPTLARLEALRPDFDRVARVFEELIDDIENRIGVLSPRFADLDEIAGSLDEGLVGFSIRAARERAWSNAKALVLAGPELEPFLIDAQDLLVASFGRALISPFAIHALGGVRGVESDDTREIIQVLEAHGCSRCPERADALAGPSAGHADVPAAEIELR